MHLPKAGQRYVTPVNARGKQHLLHVLGTAATDTPITRGIGTHARIGDEVVVDELGTKFWMRLLSVHLLPDDPEDHDGEEELLDESFDDCDQAIPPTRGPSWVTDDFLRPSRVDTLLRTPSPRPERIPSRHGILSSASAIEAIGLAVVYMANTVEEDRRNSWDSSWMSDGEFLRAGQRWGFLEDPSVAPRPWDGSETEIGSNSGESRSIHASERARDRQENQLSAIEDPPIYNMPRSMPSTGRTSSMDPRPDTDTSRGIAKLDIGPNADPYQYPSPHPPSPAVVHSGASNKDKPLPARPIDALVKPHDWAPQSRPSMLDVDAIAVQSYPTPSSSHLRVSTAQQLRLHCPVSTPLDEEALGLDPRWSGVTGNGRSSTSARRGPQGLGISF